MDKKQKQKIKTDECSQKYIQDIIEIEKRNFSNPWSEKEFKKALYDDDSDFLIAINKENILGYTISRIETTINIKHMNFTQGHLMNIAVKKGEKRKGIGTLLLKSICSKLKDRGADEIILEVRKQNKVAKNFYKKFGFIKDKKIENYYRNGDSALLMRKRLNSKSQSK